MIIHPEFDMETRTWFSPRDPSQEAETISELLVKVAKISKKTVTAKDYFPAGSGGFKLNLGMKTASDFLTRPSNSVSTNYAHRGLPWGKPGRNTVPEAEAAPTDVESKPAVALEGSVAQRSEPAAHNGLDTGSNPVVSTASKKYRTRCILKRPLTDIENHVLDLWKEGLTGQQISTRTGLSVTNVTAHIVWNARKRGDPRAVRRAPIVRGTDHRTNR